MRALSNSAPSAPAAPAARGDADVADSNSGALPTDLAEALGVERIPPTASIASLDADSLASVQASLVIEHHLGYLPADWENLAVSDLIQLQHDRTRRPLIGTDIALKALAILLVVAHHAGIIAFAGGAMLLLFLAGHAAARYHAGDLFAGERGPVMASLSYRIILPYLAVVGIFLIYHQTAHLPSLTMTANLFGPYPTGAPVLAPFWFLEVYVQLMLVLITVLAVPALRRRAAAYPWEAGVALLVTSIILAVVTLFTGLSDTTDRVPYLLAYVFAFGWCLHFADTPNKRFALTVLALVALPLLSGPTAGAGWVLFGAFALTAWEPRFSVPRWLKPRLLTISAASIYIYLVHSLPVHLVTSEWPLTAPLLSGVLAIVLSVMTGVALHTAGRLAPALWRRLKKKTAGGSAYHGSSSVSQ